MKKYIILIAIAAVAMDCSKTENPGVKDYSNVKVNLSVSMPGTLTKTNFTPIDPANPIGGMTVTWAENDKLTLIVFQGDNADWASKYVYKEILLPAAAEGQTTLDVSSLGTSLDLSGFDDSKNLKFVVVMGPSFLDSWNEFNIWNGTLYLEPGLNMNEQINYCQMIAETDVQEIPFPGVGNPITLSGKLHWMSSVLAVQFDVDAAADITYPAGSFLIMNFSGSQYVDNYKPITKLSGSYASSTSRNFSFSSAGKLSDALDANKFRYWTIPADNMTVTPEQKMGGSSISFRRWKSGESDIHYTSSISIGDVVIEPGKVYGMKIKVTDSDSDGNPEFTKVVVP